ncbi:MAG: carotenoid 1,2-hydratase [Proteobacteria bacterium]|nr:carotenoid 1,2-hydratase [Pseudomonadota bacterium]
MTLRKPWLLCLCLTLLITTPAKSEEFRRALPGRTFSFPQDHYSHPEFQTEWWYYTGHVRAHGGRSFGYQLTFFRTGLRRKGVEKSRWALNTVYFAHFALTDENKKAFVFREKISRGALGQAGAATDRLHVWVEDWVLQGDSTVHHLQARDPAMAIRFRLTPMKPPIVNGIDGVSQKAEGEGYASHYYSITRMKTQGEVTLNGEVLTVEGVSWMDHEFGSNQLRDYQVGWDWFSIQLQNNTELMLYIIRHQDGKPDPYSSGTLTHSDGTSRHITKEEFEIEVLGNWKSKGTGARYPSKWRIRIPKSNLELTVTPTVSNQELVTQESSRVIYWEGSVHVRGRSEGKPISGRGYVELTGYAEPFGKRI